MFDWLQTQASKDTLVFSQSQCCYLLQSRWAVQLSDSSSLWILKIVGCTSAVCWLHIDKNIALYNLIHLSMQLTQSGSAYVKICYNRSLNGFKNLPLSRYGTGWTDLPMYQPWIERINGHLFPRPGFQNDPEKLNVVVADDVIVFDIRHTSWYKQNVFQKMLSHPRRQRSHILSC